MCELLLPQLIQLESYLIKQNIIIMTVIINFYYYCIADIIHPSLFSCSH